MSSRIRLIIAALLLISIASISYAVRLHSELDAPKDEITRAIELGADWFVQNENDRFLHYDYNILEMDHTGKKHSLREMGGLWSIVKASKYLEDESLLRLSNKGFNHFESHLKRDSIRGYTYVNITPKKIKLGYSAMMILALLESDREERIELSKELGESILYHQNKDGSLQTFFYSERATGVDYYPGEALLALMGLYEETKEVKYLSAVQRALPFYRAYFRSNPNTAFVPWQSRAFTKLYFATGDEGAKEFVFEMNDFMISTNRPLKSCTEFDFPRGITTGVFMEGVCQAWRIAVESGDLQKADCYYSFLAEGITHILKFQISETNDPIALGGFRGSLNSRMLRVDNNQHALMALIDCRTYLDL